MCGQISKEFIGTDIEITGMDFDVIHFDFYHWENVVCQH